SASPAAPTLSHPGVGQVSAPSENMPPPLALYCGLSPPSEPDHAHTAPLLWPAAGVPPGLEPIRPHTTVPQGLLPPSARRGAAPAPPEPCLGAHTAGPIVRQNTDEVVRIPSPGA